ncbi:short chain dehydrogenase [Annulohypoxylon nitens]|nr:short chain dehydrogenase [Annulohypoxylon nitens]
MASPSPPGLGASDLYLKRTVQDLFSLKGRVTVITGGARGIGLAMAVACAEVGSDIAAIDLLETPHDHFKKLENDYGVKVKLYRSDVTKYDVLEATFKQIVKDFGRIDGLITAAGVCPDQPFIERPAASVERTLQINTLGTYFPAQLVTKQIISQDTGKEEPRGGSMIFIASTAARMASKGQYTSDYCASKGAVTALATQLSCELAEKKIRVNTISPGYTATDMTLSISETRPGLMEIFLSEPPMKRMADRVDLKGAAVYLLSDASAYMTGSDMLIDGGFHSGRT